jgi:hypothetical protein
MTRQNLFDTEALNLRMYLTASMGSERLRRYSMRARTHPLMPPVVRSTSIATAMRTGAGRSHRRRPRPWCRSRFSSSGVVDQCS